MRVITFVFPKQRLNTNACLVACFFYDTLYRDFSQLFRMRRVEVLVSVHLTREKKHSSGTAAPAYAVAHHRKRPAAAYILIVA